MAKTIVEGYFKIPFSGQMRFNARIENGTVIFGEGLENYDQYFPTRPYVVPSTYRYENNNPHARFLEDMKEDIFNFVSGKEREIKFYPEFSGKLFEKPFTENGELTMIRFYE